MQSLRDAVKNAMLTRSEMFDLKDALEALDAELFNAHTMLVRADAVTDAEWAETIVDLTRANQVVADVFHETAGQQEYVYKPDQLAECPKCGEEIELN